MPSSFRFIVKYEQWIVVEAIGGRGPQKRAEGVHRLNVCTRTCFCAHADAGAECTLSGVLIAVVSAVACRVLPPRACQVRGHADLGVPRGGLLHQAVPAAPVRAGPAQLVPQVRVGHPALAGPAAGVWTVRTARCGANFLPCVLLRFWSCCKAAAESVSVRSGAKFFAECAVQICFTGL